MTGAEAAEVLSLGDEAFWAGDRREAIARWRAARLGAERCDEAVCHAVTAMVHLRLVRREGTLAPFWHEQAWTLALARCPTTEPWCALAAADHALGVPAFAGGDPNVAVEWARPLLEVPAVAAAAAARLRLAASRGASVDVPDWPATGDDGMSRGMRASGRVEPPDPGTWTLGVGVTAAPFSGVGGFVRFVDPDVAYRGHRLSLLAFADSALQAGGAAAFAASVPANPTVSLSYSHAAAWRWTYGAAAYALDRGDASVTVGRAWSPWSLTGGGTVVWADRGELVAGEEEIPVGSGAFSIEDPRGRELVLAAGPQATLRASDARRGYNASLSGRVLADLNGAAPHPYANVDLRVTRPVGKGELVGRVFGEWAPGETWYLAPAVGGTTLLRGLPYGRFRAEALAAVQLELRHPIAGPVHGAIFVDSALCEGPHSTLGGGVRLVLPPNRDNVTRVDVGFSPEGYGWGVVLAFGQAI